jgi:hypothetical protein
LHNTLFLLFYLNLCIVRVINIASNIKLISNFNFLIFFLISAKNLLYLKFILTVSGIELETVNRLRHWLF